MWPHLVAFWILTITKFNVCDCYTVSTYSNLPYASTHESSTADSLSQPSSITNDAIDSLLHSLKNKGSYIIDASSLGEGILVNKHGYGVSQFSPSPTEAQVPATYSTSDIKQKTILPQLSQNKSIPTRYQVPLNLRHQKMVGKFAFTSYKHGYGVSQFSPSLTEAQVPATYSTSDIEQKTILPQLFQNNSIPTRYQEPLNLRHQEMVGKSAFTSKSKPYSVFRHRSPMPLPFSLPGIGPLYLRASKYSIGLPYFTNIHNLVPDKTPRSIFLKVFEEDD